MSRGIFATVALLMWCAAHATVLPEFEQPGAIWNQDVTNATLRTNSTLMMTHVESLTVGHSGSGKWGGGSKEPANFDFQIDFSFYVLHATNEAPTKIVAYPDVDDYFWPDCGDFHVPGLAPKPAPIPLPVGGGIEGTGPPDGGLSPSYDCGHDDDCHLLVQQGTTLFESYSTSVTGSGIESSCALTWDLRKTYPRYGRGEHCTSADGAGFPIAPLLFNADEVFAAEQVQGNLGHAIRFIIGNDRMQQGVHVHPSSHGTSATSDTNVNAMPYGSRLRLKQTFGGGKTVTTFSSNEAVRVMLRTLQKYGMFLSDGGRIPLTAESDYYTTNKWSDLGIDSHSFFGIDPTDFDVIDAGPAITDSGNCTLTPDDFIFIDGYDF
ncbi:MAG TPA: hypothetical protein VHW73_15050 [Rudaea sp.]|nr:hypothetical protein [Rudaea sp.]